MIKNDFSQSINTKTTAIPNILSVLLCRLHNMAPHSHYYSINITHVPDPLSPFFVLWFAHRDSTVFHCPLSSIVVDKNKLYIKNDSHKFGSVPEKKFDIEIKLLFYNKKSYF
jgi:hypothetical protein